MILLEDLRRTYSEEREAVALPFSPAFREIVTFSPLLLVGGYLYSLSVENLTTIPTIRGTLLNFILLAPVLFTARDGLRGRRLLAPIVSVSVLIFWLSLSDERPELTGVLAELLVACAMLWLTLVTSRQACAIPARIQSAIERAEAGLAACESRLEEAASGRSRAEARGRALSDIFEISKRLQFVTDREGLVTVIASALREHLGIASGWLYLTQTAGIMTAVPLYPEGAIPRTREVLLGAARDCREERFLVETPAGEELRWEPGSAARGMLLPLVQSGTSIGALYVEAEPGAGEMRFSRFEVRRLRILATQVAIALKRTQLLEQVRDLTLYDGLTGLMVHKYFREQLERELVRSREQQQIVSLLMCDVDHFKRFNDMHGHLIGDEVLREVSRALQESVRTMDVVCRYGGEEFAVMLPQTAHDGAALVAERIRARLDENRFCYRDREYHVTISIGVAQFPVAGFDGESIIRAADQALYRAKAEGRNRVR